jgi:hypothetical protein
VVLPDRGRLRLAIDSMRLRAAAPQIGEELTLTEIDGTPSGSMNSMWKASRRLPRASDLRLEAVTQATSCCE